MTSPVLDVDHRSNSREDAGAFTILSRTTIEGGTPSTLIATYDPGFLKLVAFNNKGVQFFEKRDYIEAINCFRKTLELCKAIVTHTPDDIYCPPKRLGCPFEQGIAQQQILAGLSFRCGMLVPDDSCSRCTYDCFMLQDSCIRLAPESFSVFANNLNHLATIVIYNCGLAFHMQGHDTNSKDILDKALTLYRQALALINCDITSKPGADGHARSVTGNALLDFVHLAIVNNVGIIMRYDCLDIDTSQAFFGRLVVLVRAFQSAYCTPTPDREYYTSPATSSNLFISGISGQDMSLVARIVDEFLLNAVAFHCCTQITTCAPAA